MAEPRVKAKLWVQMALRLGDADGKPGMVIHHGDDDAGGILVLLRGRDGVTALSQTRDQDGRPAWVRALGAEPVAPERADDYVTRQRRFDPDLWVIEFEAPDHLPPFDGKLI